MCVCVCERVCLSALQDTTWIEMHVLSACVYVCMSVCKICNTMQHVWVYPASHCNTPQHTTTHYNIYSTLQHTVTHCNTLRHTRNSLQHTTAHGRSAILFAENNEQATSQHTATHCNTLQHTATHCNTPQHMKDQPFYLQRTTSKQPLLLKLAENADQAYKASVPCR